MSFYRKIARFSVFFTLLTLSAFKSYWSLSAEISSTSSQFEGTITMRTFDRVGREVFTQSGPFAMISNGETLFIRISPVRSIRDESGTPLTTLYESMEFSADKHGSVSVIRRSRETHEDSSMVEVVRFDSSGKASIEQVPASRQTATINNAQAFVASTPLPSSTHSIMLPLWLMRGTFLPRTSPAKVEVLYDDFRFEKPKPPMAQARWYWSVRSRDIIESFHSSFPSDVQLTNFSYQVTKWTPSGELQHPKEFVAQRFRLTAAPGGPDVRVASIIEGEITNITATLTHGPVVNLDGAVWVSDHRFSRDHIAVKGVGYMVKDGTIPSVETVRKFQIYQSSLVNARARRREDLLGSLSKILLGILIIFPLAWLGMRKLRSNAVSHR